MGRWIFKVARWTWLVPAALVLACLPLLAATFANNSATVAAPAGVIDAVGGCNTNNPPDCTGNNASSATVNVWATTVAKSSTPANGSTVLAGQTISYTLTATVTGPNTTAPVTFTDTLGTGLTFGSVTSAGVFSAGGSGQVRTFSLPAGTAAGTYAVTYTATVNAGATGTVGNSVAGGAGCTSVGACTTSHPVGSVSVSKALTSESGSQAGIAEAGETLTYTITLSNPSATAISNFNLTDTLSAGLSFVSSSPAGSNAGQTTTWTTLSIPANGTSTVTVTASVNVPISTASVSNLAKPTGQADPACPSASCVVTPTTSTVTVAKSSSPANGSTVLVGQTLNYTLTATVTGAATAVPTVFTDTLGAGLTFGSVTSAGVFTAGGSGQTRTFTLPAATSAGTYAVTYTATVNAGATGTVGNSVSGGAGCTTVGACTTSHIVGSVSVSKALTSESGSQAGIAEAGETLTYTITLSNPSATAISNFNLTDTLSAGLTYVSSSAGGVNAGQTTTWTTLSIPANGSSTVSLTATVNSPITTASVNNVAKPTGQADPACPSAACVVTPTTSTVTVAKSSAPANGSTVLAGQTLSYTLTATVVGSNTSAPTVFTDTLGAGLTFGSVTAPGVFTAGGSGQVRTFTLPAGTSAGTYAVTYTAIVNAGATGSLGNSVAGGAGCTSVGACSTSHPVGSVGVSKVLTSESGSQAGIAEGGETLTYTITLSNPSATAISNFNLTDTLSAGLSYVSSSPAGSNAGQTTTWTTLSIPANGTSTVTVTASVNAPISTASVSNLAKPTGQADPACPSASCVVMPTTSTVTIAKSSTPANGSTVLAGQTLSYTLTATVVGSNTSAPTVFTDTLGTGLTFGSVTSPGVFTAGGSGQVRTFTLPAGTSAGTYAVTYTATVNAGATGSLSNSVTGGAGCTTVGACTTSHTVGSVGVSKALTSESGSQAGIAEAGETLTYTITLSNPSATAISNFNLTDTLSAGLSFVSSSPAGSNAGQTTTWNTLSIPANGTSTVTVTASVNAPISTASVSNLAKPTGQADPACPSAACVVTPTTSTVTVAKSSAPANGSTVLAGQTLSYTLTATVVGSNTSAPTVFTDTLGAGLTFGAVTSPGVFTPGGAGQTRTFSLPAGTAAGTYAVTYTATVDSGATGTLSNGVTGGAGCTTVGACTTSHPVGAVGVSKALTSESGSQAGIAEAGETLTYTITLSNPSATAVSTFNLSDTLSAGLSFVSSSPAGSNAGQTTTWTTLSIPANGTSTVTVTASVNAPISTASVSNLAKSTGQADPACPSAACVVTPTTSTVTVAKSSSPVNGSTVLAGQTLSYTLTATVVGSNTSAPTVFTDTLGAGLTFGSVTSAGIFTAGGSGQTRTFTLPAATSAGTYAVTYTATVNAGATGTVGNSVSGGAGCTTVGACTTSHTVGSVSVSKALTSESGSQAGIAEAGETLTYTITLINPSATAISNFNLTDTLSAGLTYVSSSAGGVNAGQTTTWTTLSIPANGTSTVTVTASVNAPISTASVSNLAKPTGQADPACPSAACVVTPTTSTVTIAKSSSPVNGSTVLAGQTLSYTLTATVTGASTAAPTVFTDTFGAGLTFGSVTAPGIFTAGGSGQVRTFTLPAGTSAGTYAVTYTATVNAGATGTVGNSVSGGAGCTTVGACSTSHTVGSVSVSKALTSESGSQAGIAEAGETLTYTITLSNPSATAISNFNLTDTLSAGLTYVSSSAGGVNAGQTTTWTTLSIPANGSSTVSLTATVNSPITTASVNNVAKPTGQADPACPSAACVVTPTTSTVTVAKSSAPANGSTVLAGQTLSYTLTATVVGSNTSAPTVFTDTLGAGLTFGSVTAPGVFTAGGSGQVRTFTLPAGTSAGTYAVTYTAIVNAGATGSLGNSVAGGAGCTSVGACSTSHPVGSVGVSKVLTSESGSQAGIAEGGETLTYTITLSNPSATAISNFNLTDTLSAGLSYVSSSPAGSNAGQTTTWTTLSIPANGTSTVTVTASVNAPISTASVSNLAKPTGQADPACPSASCVVMPTTSTVTIAKSSTPANGSTVLAGQTLSYTLTATVVGSNTSAPTVFTDTLGAGLTFGAVTSPGVFTPGGAGQTRTFSLPAGTAAGTYAVTYTATVDSGATGTLSNGVTGGAGCTTVGACTTSHPVGAVGVSKALTSESGSQAGIAEAGETLTYTITLSNPSATAVSTFNLSDTLSPSLTFVSASPAGSNSGQTTTWANLSIPANGTSTVTVTASVNAPISTASVSNLAKPTGQADPACPSAACVVTPTTSTVTVAKSSAPANGSTVLAGQTLSYTLSATVVGSNTSAPTVFTDTLGAGLTFGSVTSAGIFTAGGSGQTRTFTLPAATSAGTYAVTYTATVNAGATGTVGNSVAGGAGCTTVGACTTSHSVGAVGVSKALTGESGTQAGIAEAGETLTYTITLSNPSATAVSNFNLTDTLSAGLTYVSSSPAGLNAGQTTTWTTLSIPANGTSTVTVTASVNAPISTASVSNLAKPTGQADPACPSAACVVTPTTSTVTVAKSSAPAVGGTVVPGQTLSYTLTATVVGSNTSAPTVFTDTLGVGLAFDVVTSPGVFTAGGSGQTRTFSLPAGTAAGTYAVTYTATVNAGATGTVGNSVIGGAGCTSVGACTTTHAVGSVAVGMILAAESGFDAGIAEPGETLTYTITLSNPSATAVSGFGLTDTLSAGLTYVSSSAAGVNAGQTTTWTNLSIPANGTLTITVTATVSSVITHGSVSHLAKPTGQSDPACPSAGCAVMPTAASVAALKQLSAESGALAGVAEPGETLTYTIRLTNAGGTAFTNYRLTENVPPGATLVGVSGAVGFAGPVTGPGTLSLVVPTVPAAGVAVVTVQFQVASQLPGGLTALPNVISGGDLSPLCASACAVSIPVGNPVALGLVKSAAVREARVGDLVRYSIRVSNLGVAAVSGLSVVDTPAPGFSYVAGSMSVADADGAFSLGAGPSPLHIGGIDIAGGGEAVISYLLRVGAGVRQGVHTNRAQAQNSLGQPVSGIASAQVQVVGDPLLDEALLLGTVFDDRDGDGWQDPAHLSGVKVQGGFAPGVYLAGSTTVDRGQGPQPVADASAPLLHGMSLGSISARQTQADPVESHQVVVRQRVSDLAFTDAFVLTSEQGVTVRMDAAGQTVTERAGEAAKGLNAAAPSVERRIAKVEGGYEVAYVVRNHGIDERGIPGVRIATVEGLLIESDPFGRFHLTGIAGGDAAQGRNFILKIDPTTLPDGATLSTPNPLVRRITPGLPARFDFGVKLPVQVLHGRELVEVELGEVLFEPGSTTLRQEHAAVIEKMVGKVQAHGGGELVIRAGGESAALALGRARALDDALSSRLTPEVAKATRVAVRAEMNDPDSLVAGVGPGGLVLGTVLFDTDQAQIRAVYRPLLADVARQLASMQGGVVSLVGHADRRASDAHNLALGLRRAQALYQALVEELPPEARAKVRVDILPNAPHGTRPGPAAGPTP